MKAYQAKRCGCDFLISSSNSRVESPVLWSQMSITRRTSFPQRSSTLLSSRAIGGTSTVRSSLICISSASNTCAGSNTYSSIVRHEILDEGSPTAGVRLSRKPPVQSSSWSDRGQGTWAKASLSGEPFPRPWFGSPSGIHDHQLRTPEVSSYGLHRPSAYSEKPVSCSSPFSLSQWFALTILVQPTPLPHPNTNIEESYTS